MSTSTTSINSDENGFEIMGSLLQQNLSICPEDVYSTDQRAYRLYANAPISLFGIVSNILNIIVFMDIEMRQQLVNHFLLALSISDLFLLLCNFFFLVLPVLVVEMDSFFWNDLFPTIIRYSYPLALTVQTTGVYLTVLVSVHRFLGVCHPFKAKRWVTRTPVESAIIGSILFSFVVNIPTWMELSVEPCFSDRFNRPSHQIQLASFHDGNYIIFKKCIAYTVIMFILPFSILITVNWKIVLALGYSSRMRSNTQYNCSIKKTPSNDNISRQFELLRKSRYSEVFRTISKISYSSFLKPSSELFKPKFINSTRDRSITMMLLAIVGLFLLCNGLAFLNSIVESIMLILTQSGSYEDLQQVAHQEFASNITNNANLIFEENTGEEDANWQLKITKWFESSVEISNVLITLNSSTSTLVYLIFSSKYRMIFKSLIGLHKRDKLNRVALTTAVAARRVMELSLIPEEVESRWRRRNTQVNDTECTEMSPFHKGGSSVIRRDYSLDSPCSNGSTKKARTQRFFAQFRQQSTPAQNQHALVRECQSSVQLHTIPPAAAVGGGTINNCSSSAAIQRRTMFRGLQKSSKEMFKSQSSLNRSLTNSESNLRLMDEQEVTGETLPEKTATQEINFELIQMHSNNDMIMNDMNR